MDGGLGRSRAASGAPRDGAPDGSGPDAPLFAASQEASGPHGRPAGDPPHGAPRDATISRLVADVVGACEGERISLGTIAAAFGDRAFGLTILLLLLPGLLPGMATVFGLPVLVLGVQMGMGRRTPCLPGFLARRTVRRDDLLRLSQLSGRWLGRVERHVRPNPGWFVGPGGDRLFGWLSACTALMLILPGPGTNGPPAFGNIVMALGLVEHDNRVTAWGAALTVAGNLFAAAVLGLLLWLGWQGLSWLT